VRAPQYEGPYIDERVKHVGVSRLRTLNATSLRDFRDTLVIQDNDTPLAVVLPYEQFLAMQKRLVSLLNTVEMFHNGKEPEAILEGLKSLTTSTAKDLDEVRDSVKKPHRNGK
jgi:hypothetical protein